MDTYDCAKQLRGLVHVTGGAFLTAPDDDKGHQQENKRDKCPEGPNCHHDFHIRWQIEPR